MKKKYSELLEDIPEKNFLRLFYLQNKLQKSIKIDIILPAYNRQNTIKKAIQSVINQGHNNWNLYIWDDGSTDNTRHICNEFVTDPRIHYYHSLMNKGVSYARNQCLARSSSQIITYLDSDNQWAPEYLQCICSFIIKYKLQAAYLGLKLVDEGGVRGCIGKTFSWKDCHSANYIDINCFAHTRLQLQEMRRNWNYHFDESIDRLVDWDFILRLTKGQKCRFLELYLVNYYCGRMIKRITRSNYLKDSDLRKLIFYIQSKHCT